MVLAEVAVSAGTGVAGARGGRSVKGWADSRRRRPEWELGWAFRAEGARRDVDRDDCDRLDRSGMRDGGMMSFEIKIRNGSFRIYSALNSTSGTGIPAGQTRQLGRQDGYR